MNGTPASGDTVYIKAGTYKTSATIEFNNTTNKALHLYGGFNGTETTSSDRNPAANVTTISGDNNFQIFNISTNSTVDGFTVTGGNAISSGGGIFIGGGSPTITNCTVTDNTAISGGGIFIGIGSPTITNCVVTGNTASDFNDGGGGIFIGGGSPTITNCTVTDNTAANNNGGGIDIGSGNPIISNCTITGNTATASSNGGGGGGISIGVTSGSNPNPIIINCTITGNNTGRVGGGIYIESGNPTITNCTIVNNTASSFGNEIYFYQGTTNLRNTLIWNTANTANATDGNNNSATYTYNNCAYPSATGDNNIILSAWANPASTDVKVNGVTHKVYKILDNYEALQSIIGKGSHDVAPSFDQIGNAFANPPSIGAAEYVPPVLSADISGDIEISTSYGTAKTLTFTPTVSLDNVALTTGYTLSWDVSVSPTASTISIDQSGKLTIGATTPAGSYDVTVKAQATYTAITTPVIKSNIAEKKVNITVESGDINLTLTSKDLPSGKVGTVYSEDQYFTATATPSSADIAWSVEGLPAGLSFDKGKISGTPTKLGNFTVKAVVSAKLKNYNDASKDVQFNITVESGDMTLTLTQKTLPNGKVNTAYTGAQYFTATVEPSSADLTWSVEGLPAGLSFNKGTISGTPTKAGNFTVKAVVSAKLENYNDASKDVQFNITVESGDMTLTLTQKTLPNGKVNTAYTGAQYFTATVDPSSADIAWKVEGLPAGLSFNKGTISGTPTASGDFSVKVTVTATLANYTTASKNITASLKIEAADKQDEQDKQDEEEQKEEENTKTDSDLDKMTPEEKKQVKSITFTDLSNLEYISKNSADFSNLKTVKISSDAVVSNNGELDLSVLPATVTNFSISGNVSLKSLNLKESKVANIDASGCSELKSVDVSGNTSIITLDVRSTDIEILDASNCSNLTSIDCSYCLLSELNVEASNALKSINCSHNSLLALDIPSGLANLASVDCISQELGNWRSVVSFNFDDFSESPDIIPSEDNTASASSVVRLSATKLSNVENLKAYNKSGDIIPVIASDDNGNITFASAPDIMTYDYNIGFNNTSMDVTVYASNGNSNNTLSGSGGGCSLIRNEGLGIRNVLILLLLFVLAPLKIKKI